MSELIRRRIIHGGSCGSHCSIRLMLSHLSIRDFVLIERLDLKFQSGLNVLTGETGAGKSILLDALGLATGTRAESRFVRKGASSTSVTAVFELPIEHPIRSTLVEHNIQAMDETIILRRTVETDGRSRAFINDQAISVGLLNKLGQQIIEIHGQFDNQRLMRPDNHREILDSFTGATKLLTSVRIAYQKWSDASTALEQGISEAADTKKDEEFLRFAVEEINVLSPLQGEEEKLSNKRKLMMHGEKLVEALTEVQEQLQGETPIDQRMQNTLRTLERANTYSDGKFKEVIQRFESGLNDILDGREQLDRLNSEIIVDPAELEITEERLFALRALARKHQVNTDDLNRLKEDFVKRLSEIESNEARLAQLKRNQSSARNEFIDNATRVRNARQKAAKTLEKAVNEELDDLKLTQARFYAHVVELKEEEWNKHGIDRVLFLVSTNPKIDPGPINKIASGGELARFMLALKAVLATVDPIPTLIFDEADTGVGGAIASAVGDRLVLLSEGSQVLVVTHSPQVAAKGRHHWRVSKSVITNDKKFDQMNTTIVESLDEISRKEEIARMLAGAEITEEARAAADRLITGGKE